MLPEDSLQESQQELIDYLQTVAQNYAFPDVALRTEVISGDEASVIVDTAASENVDLIVMSTHGYSGLTRWMLGSITEKVLRAAPCPVLVVRSLDPISRILITLDGSELAEYSIEPGLEIARRLDGEVTLLRVEHAPAPSPLRFEQQKMTREALRDEDKVQKKIYDFAKIYLARMVESHRQSGQHIETAVSFETPAVGILDYAELNQTDLIVMSTHGRTGLAHWVYGSVTEKVLRGAECAMLIIRPPADELN
jgi:nucleotide-binding universal stress UspA family protein